MIFKIFLILMTIELSYNLNKTYLTFLSHAVTTTAVLFALYVYILYSRSFYCRPYIFYTTYTETNSCVDLINSNARSVF